MPWRGPEYPGEFPTLGYQVAQWIQERCAIPDREHAGQAFLLTDRQIGFLLNHYRIDPVRGRFYWARGSQLVKPKKYGKGPLAAAMCCAEGGPDSPVVFDGWDANGEPVGRPWPTPWIQVTASSERQAENIWSVLRPMIELGALAASIDTLANKIYMPNGLMELVTSSAQTARGQRITFVPQDQTELWTPTNGGRKLADEQRLNLGGTGGRFLETPNAWDPAVESVARETNTEHGVYVDFVQPGRGSIRNARDRRRMLKKVYDDAATKPRPDAEWEPWVDLDRIEDECIALVKRDPALAERNYFNRLTAAESAGFDPELLDERKKPFEPVPGRLYVAGIDGARFVDGLAMIATDVRSGQQWELGIWERPESAAPDYEHPFAKIDGTLTEFIERLRPWRIYVDPQYIEDWLAVWQGRWGEKRIVPWRTNRPYAMAHAVREYTDAIANGHVRLWGDDFIRHLKNARREKVKVFDEKTHRQLHVLSKETPDSPLKMDGAPAGVISWQCRIDAIAADAKPASPGGTYAFL
jgi:hypothetical protein